MSDKKIHLTIATPLGTLYSGEVNQVTVTTTTGELTILPNHIPLVTTLKIGQVMLRDNKEDSFYTIDGGILEVRHNNQVVILSDRSENADDIDIKRAEEALQRARKCMEECSSSDSTDYARLEQDIARELNRIKLTQKGSRK